MNPIRRIYLYLRTLLLFASILAILLGVCYWLFCDRADQLSEVPIGGRVVIVGQVQKCFPADGPAGPFIYQIADPTAKVFVITSRGLPRPGAIVVLMGDKAVTDQERPLLVETWRAGSF